MQEEPTKKLWWYICYFLTWQEISDYQHVVIISATSCMLIHNLWPAVMKTGCNRRASLCSRWQLAANWLPTMLFKHKGKAAGLLSFCSKLLCFGGFSVSDQLDSEQMLLMWFLFIQKPADTSKSPGELASRSRINNFLNFWQSIKLIAVLSQITYRLIASLTPFNPKPIAPVCKLPFAGKSHKLLLFAGSCRAETSSRYSPAGFSPAWFSGGGGRRLIGFHLCHPAA